MRSFMSVAVAQGSISGGPSGRAYSYGAYRRCSMSSLPSGSAKIAMWQTPVSNVSPKNWTPLASSTARISATSSQRSGPPLPLGMLVGAQPQDAAVEGAGALGVLRGDAEEVESFNDSHGARLPQIEVDM